MSSFWGWGQPKDAVQLMEDRDFAHKPAKHPRSGLPQLPREIQTMILRRLLVSDIPIGVRQRYSVAVSSRARPDRRYMKQVWRHGLSPEVLRTCQALFRVGSKILYNDNTPSISVHMRQDIDMCPRPRHGSVDCTKGCCDFIAAIGQDLFHSFDYIQADDLHYWQELNGSTVFASRFGALQFHVMLGLDRPVYFAFMTWLQRTKSLVARKSIRVRLDVINHFQSRKRRVEEGKMVHEQDMVNAFMLWRCRDFNFDTHMGFFDPSTVHEAVIQRVESEDDVLDLLPSFLNTKALFHHICVRYPDREATCSVYQKAVVTKARVLFQALFAALTSFDRLEFSSARAEIILLFKKVTERAISDALEDNQINGGDECSIGIDNRLLVPLIIRQAD